MPDGTYERIEKFSNTLPLNCENCHIMIETVTKRANLFKTIFQSVSEAICKHKMFFLMQNFTQFSKRLQKIISTGNYHISDANLLFNIFRSGLFDIWETDR